MGSSLALGNDKMASPSVLSSAGTSWSAETASETDDVHNVNNFVMCSFAHRTCSPLLQGNLQEEEVCKVALTCHFALDVFLLCTENIRIAEDVSVPWETGGICVWLSSDTRLRMRTWLDWCYEGVEDNEDIEEYEEGEGVVQSWWQCCVLLRCESSCRTHWEERKW